MKMLLRNVLLFGLILIIILGPTHVKAELTGPCLTDAALTIKRDMAVTVFPFSGESIRGRLLSIDLKDSLLSIYRIDSSGSRQFKYKAGEILKIEYHPRWQFKPRYLLFGTIGFLAGAFIGQQVEELIDPGYQIKWWPFERRLSYEDGAKFGALGGFLTGILIPMAIPTTRTISCNQ
jgi:hypothetical protein